MVSPRSSINTRAAIFFARPAGVFMLFVRNASAKRFWPERPERFARPRARLDGGAKDIGDGVFRGAAHGRISGIPSAVGDGEREIR
jgi:hypothetical protein